MTKRTQLILKSLALACFSASVLLFFRFYSILRPIAYEAFYKEWLAGIIVLALCFLNYFVLYPLLYEKRRFFVYVLATLLSTATGTLLELILVYPQISPFINMITNNSPQEYYVIMVILLFLRDTCFVFFFFLINLLESTYDENMDVNILLQNTNELLVARTDDKNKTLVTVRLADIAYCQQNENYAYMYLINGTKVYRNCSLKNLYELLTPSKAVRISRKTLVPYRHIESYDNRSVYVIVSDKDLPIGLEITDSYRQQALQLLKKHCSFDKNIETETHPVITTVSAAQKSSNAQQTRDTVQACDSDKNEDKQTASMVHSFISAHPDCKGSDIAEHLHVSLSTVNRILAQLKAEGLVEYVGSKKTGGYQAKTTNNEP